MFSFMLAAPSSGSGKTTLTLALLAELKRRGLKPCAFKCGPDYIDPMLHRAVLDVPCRNLDLFLSSENYVNLSFQSSADYGAAVVEAAMGFYDGLGGVSTEASAWHVADTLKLPVVLVVRPKGASLTLAAQIRGLTAFRDNSRIIGIILNDCRESLHNILKPILEAETGLKVLGYMPHIEGASLESRHLGLYTAGEIEDIQSKIELLRAQAEKNIDFDTLQKLCTIPDFEPILKKSAVSDVRIAVARDKAFCFIYEETLEALRNSGAELCFFSPLHDQSLPENIGAMYLPGGYPELHARELSGNTEMRQCIKTAIETGMPTVAECGGFLYLGASLEGADGTAYPMVGCLPGEAKNTGHLVRFGYSHIHADSDSLLFRAGDSFPVHEFHYWDSSDNGNALMSVKPGGKRSWSFGYVNQNLYAGFPHLYFAGSVLPERFTQAARAYLRNMK